MHARQELVEVVLKADLVRPVAVEEHAVGEQPEGVFEAGRVRRVVGREGRNHFAGQALQQGGFHTGQRVYGRAGCRYRVRRDLHFDDQHQQQLGEREKGHRIARVQGVRGVREAHDRVAAESGHVAGYGGQAHPQRSNHHVVVLDRQRRKLEE